MERIANRCPACGNQTLFIGAGGWLTCSWIECPNPLVSDYLDAARALTARELTLTDVARLLRAFHEVKAEPLNSIRDVLADLEQKPEIH